MDEKRAGRPAISVLWMILAVFSIAYIATNYLADKSPRAAIPYSTFKKDLQDNRIKSVTVEGEFVRGKYREKQNLGSPSPGTSEIETDLFETVLPPFDDPELLRLLEKNNVTVEIKSTEGSMLWSIVISFLPWVLFLGLIFYMSSKMRQQLGGLGGGGPGGTGGVFDFMRSKARRFDKEMTRIKYEDVAGLENAKNELIEISDYLKKPEKFLKVGAKIPRGILLVGPPGTGKTLLARAIAGEASVPFFSISGSEFVEMFVGVGASRVRDMFKEARKDAPSIIFIDEIDSVGKSRGAGIGGGYDEKEQTLNQILSEMDGFDPNEKVVVIAATNRPDVLDNALLRPGRFDRKVFLDLPQKEARIKILKIHTRKVRLSEDVDLEKIARTTVGFSGADIANLVNEAAMHAARTDRSIVIMEDFKYARDRIRMGLEREEVLDENERKLVAYHEAGHTILALLLENADPVDKVSIIPRGQALGMTEQVPEEDRHNFTESYLKDRITVMMGGRVAEKIVFNEITSGGADDLKQATFLARRMVVQLGMNKKIGPVSFQRGEEHVFLGKEIAREKDYSEYTARVIDREIRDLISDLEEKAMSLLLKNRDKLDTLAGSLLERETLELAEIEQLLDMSSE